MKVAGSVGLRSKPNKIFTMCVWPVPMRVWPLGALHPWRDPLLLHLRRRTNRREDSVKLSPLWPARRWSSHRLLDSPMLLQRGPHLVESIHILRDEPRADVTPRLERDERSVRCVGLSAREELPPNERARPVACAHGCVLHKLGVLNGPVAAAVRAVRRPALGRPPA